MTNKKINLDTDFLDEDEKIPELNSNQNQKKETSTMLSWKILKWLFITLCILILVIIIFSDNWIGNICCRILSRTTTIPANNIINAYTGSPFILIGMNVWIIWQEIVSDQFRLPNLLSPANKAIGRNSWSVS